MSQYPYSIPSRENILSLLRSANGPQDLDSIAQALDVAPQEQEGLTRRLNAMLRDGQVLRDENGLIRVADASHLVEGYVSSHRDGFGFLLSEQGDGDLFLSEKEMQKVLHGDRVRARVAGTDRRGRREGAIVEVVKRANTHLVGRTVHENGTWIVVPEDNRINQDILLSSVPKHARAGQIVSVELLEQPSRYTQPVGRIVEVLGDIDDPGMEIEIAVRKFDVPHQFSEAALKAAARLPDQVGAADLNNRVDLRDVPLVTIDGEDARDFDDAVYCEPVKIGRTNGHRLIVAIADVSHYVRPEEPLDHDALERSTSVYFPRRVIPMLPEKLSNGLCSLNPAVDRLTLVCDLVINAKGEITAYQFYPGVIRSAARLTYTEVAAILENPKGPEGAMRSALVPHLQHLNAAFKALLEARRARGAIDFETTETYIVSNELGKIEAILPRTRNDAHKIIEECMLAANVCAADFLEQHKQHGLYRVHASPAVEKLEQLRTFLKQLGLHLGGGDSPSASDYAELMPKIKERPDALLIQTMLLRSMRQAVYSPDNLGHFGLSYEAYAHFTSPIRRYPDLLVHRAIKSILQGKRYHPKNIDTESLNKTLSPAARKQESADQAAGKKKQKTQGDLAIWEALGIHCSANERRADEASRDVEAWLKCHFIRDHIGEEFTGTVSGVTSFGLFVQLDALFIEGLVHVTDLGSDYFQYDEARHELRGERTGQRYQLTDRVTVQVTRVDLDARKIDFHMIADHGSPAIDDKPGKQSDKPGKKKGQGQAKREDKPSSRNEGKSQPRKQEAQKEQPKREAPPLPKQEVQEQASQPVKGKGHPTHVDASTAALLKPKISKSVKSNNQGAPKPAPTKNKKTADADRDDHASRSAGSKKR